MVYRRRRFVSGIRSGRVCVRCMAQRACGYRYYTSTICGALYVARVGCMRVLCPAASGIAAYDRRRVWYDADTNARNGKPAHDMRAGIGMNL
jgi:hypothetical protein